MSSVAFPNYVGKFRGQMNSNWVDKVKYRRFKAQGLKCVNEEMGLFLTTSVEGCWIDYKVLL